MHAFTPHQRGHRLTVVAILVMQHVVEEDRGHPWPGQARGYLDAASGPAVAAEAEMAEPSRWGVAPPGDRNGREIAEPGGMHLLCADQEGVGPERAEDWQARRPGPSCCRGCRRNARRGSMQQRPYRRARAAPTMSFDPLNNRYRTVGIIQQLRMHPQYQAHSVTAQTEQAAPGPTQLNADFWQTGAQGYENGVGYRRRGRVSRSRSNSRLQRAPGFNNGGLNGRSRGHQANSREPTRTTVAPSSTAMARSPDMPIESPGRPLAWASSRKWMKQSRTAAASA